MGSPRDGPLFPQFQFQPPACIKTVKRVTMKLVCEALLLLLVPVFGQNKHYFNYAYENDDVDGNPSWGQPNWGKVQCGNENICTGYPNKFPNAKGWEEDDMGNNCEWCVQGGPKNCGIHRQSPINLKRDRGIDGGPKEKLCYDWHWMQYKDDTCSWNDMKDQFSVERHALRIEVPTLSNGDIDCVENGERLYPRLDYSKGFPDWWWLERTEVTVPSQHRQEGKHYDAEVTLAHFYEIAHHKNEMGHVTLLMDAYDDARSWPFLDKLICAWRDKEDKIRQQCGKGPVEPYGRCSLKRGQEPTEEWLREAGLLISEEGKTDPPEPTSSPVSSPTASPIDSPTAFPTKQPTEPTPPTPSNPSPTESPKESPVDSSSGACDASDPKECGCATVNQADYRGTISFTTTGRKCQEWGSQEPHSHSRTAQRFPDSGLEANYCRNPDGEDGAWCYTTDPNKRWELCVVPTCGQVDVAPTSSPVNKPTSSPVNESTASPVDKPTASPVDKPIAIPTVVPTAEPAPVTEMGGLGGANPGGSPDNGNPGSIPPPIDCSAFAANYKRMCYSSDPCCESVRSDTNFCWDMYDLFPGDAIYSACYHCCDPGQKIVGPPNPPNPEIPKTIQCSDVNAQRMCKEGGCCTDPYSGGYCATELSNFGSQMREICWHCCSEPRDIGPMRNRKLRGNSAVEVRSLAAEGADDIELEVDDIPDGAKVMEVGGKRYLLRKENFLEDDEGPDEYFERIYSDHKDQERRYLQDDTTHDEDYADIRYWPYEWLLKVGTEYYFRYEGTQVVPPCREFVHWRVMKDPIKVHPRQIKELNRLLAHRLAPQGTDNSCNVDTAGVLSPDGDRVKVNRDVQYLHKGHRMVFCECKDWPSRFDRDRQWCRNWKQDTNYTRFYEHPYSFNSNGEW